MAGSRVTVRDIAEAAGVSVATVSRVINHNGRFSKETEKRVMDAIAKYDYQPNQLARGLRHQRSDTIGVIVPNIANDFFSKMILTMQEEFFEAGFSIIIYNTNHSLDIERQCYDSLAAQRVSGIVSANSLEDVRVALRRDVPTVYIDRFVEERDLGPKVSSVMSDNVRSGRLAAEELVRSGSMRPLVITATAHFPITSVRTRSFREGLAERGVRLEDSHVIAPPATDFKSGYDVTCGVLERGLAFDGLFCETDRLAVGALEALRKRGIRVPDDVAVVGHDDILLASFGRPPLTTIRQEPKEIGRLAARTMLQMVSGELGRGRHELVPVSLVRRESTMRGELARG